MKLLVNNLCCFNFTVLDKVMYCKLGLENQRGGWVGGRFQEFRLIQDVGSLPFEK